MDPEKQRLSQMQIGILLAAFIYIVAVTFLDMTAIGADHSKTVVGFLLGTVIGTIIQYNWGSSKGSTDKSEALMGAGNKPVEKDEVKS